MTIPPRCSTHFRHFSNIPRITPPSRTTSTKSPPSTRPQSSGDASSLQEQTNRQPSGTHSDPSDGTTPSSSSSTPHDPSDDSSKRYTQRWRKRSVNASRTRSWTFQHGKHRTPTLQPTIATDSSDRSEERRVGKEGRSRW